MFLSLVYSKTGYLFEYIHLAFFDSLGFCQLFFSLFVLVLELFFKSFDLIVLLVEILLFLLKSSFRACYLRSAFLEFPVGFVFQSLDFFFVVLFEFKDLVFSLNQCGFLCRLSFFVSFGYYPACFFFGRFYLRFCRLFSMLDTHFVHYKTEYRCSDYECRRTECNCKPHIHGLAFLLF